MTTNQRTQQALARAQLINDLTDQFLAATCVLVKRNLLNRITLLNAG